MDSAEAVRRTEPALGDLLRSRLRELLTLIEQRGERVLEPIGLTPPLNHLLDAVAAEPGVTASGLARRLRKSQQAMSQAADRLERLGLIERRLGARRAVGLHVTDTGRTAAEEGRRRECAVEDEITAAIGAARVAALRSALREASDALSAVASPGRVSDPDRSRA